MDLQCTTKAHVMGAWFPGNNTIGGGGVGGGRHGTYRNWSLLEESKFTGGVPLNEVVGFQSLSSASSPSLFFDQTEVSKLLYHGLSVMLSCLSTGQSHGAN